VVFVDDQIKCINLCDLSTVIISLLGCCFAWWLLIQSWLYFRCNTYVGVSCMRVLWELLCILQCWPEDEPMILKRDAKLTILHLLVVLRETYFPFYYI